MQQTDVFNIYIEGPLAVKQLSPLAAPQWVTEPGESRPYGRRSERVGRT